MSLSIDRFGPEHLAAVREMADAAYPRPRNAAYHRWAYLEDPSHRAWVALDGDRCVALLRAFAVSYRLDDTVVGCLETFDWYATEEGRRAAAGLRVMRAAMEEPEPLVNVGGTPDTLAILPRMGWHRLDEAASFVLPLAGRAATTALPGRRRALRPAGRVALAVAARAWFGRGRQEAPPNGEVLAVAAPGHEVLALYEGAVERRTVPVPNIEHLRWLARGAPGVGRFLTLVFVIGGSLRGWGMIRVYEGPDGPEASLIEAFAPRPEPVLARWMVSELIERTRPYRPILVRAQATCPILTEALSRMRFVRARSRPVLTWSAGPWPGGSPTHFAMSTQDFPLLPYPTTWDATAPAAGSPVPPAGTTEDADVA